ncbi:MAG: hypothetical protein GY854_10705, partial [Deltaproteobacteria bacterium]|nr:hypothetical protein [Deltaproteobacteria bacterium]
NPIADMVRWEMDPRGEFRTNLNGPGDVKAFTCAFVIRGFDIDEGLPIDAGTLVYETHVDAEQIH